MLFPILTGLGGEGLLRGGAAEERGLKAVGTKWAVSGQTANVYVALEVSAWRGAVMGPRLGVLGAPGLRLEKPGRVWAGMALSRGRLGKAVQLEAPGRTGFRGGGSSAPTRPSQPRAQPRDPGSRLRRPGMRLSARDHSSRRAQRPLPGPSERPGSSYGARPRRRGVSSVPLFFLARCSCRRRHGEATAPEGQDVS